MRTGPLVYYVTAHGNGHAVRSCDILRALGERCPGLPVIVVSGSPEAFFRERLNLSNLRVRAGSFDVGFVQRDAVCGDAEATLAGAQRLLREHRARVEQEAAFLAKAKACAVVCDIPVVPIEAASRAGIPALAVGNFGWDWIYGRMAEGDDRWRPLVSLYGEGYRSADLLLRLPFHEPMDAFPRRVDLPLLSRPGRDSRETIARACGASPAARWVLVAFSGLDWSPEALNRLAATEGWVFLAPAPVPWRGGGIHAVDRSLVSFPDLLASCDVVLSKPGYGILSECAVNDRPLAYALREDFPEMQVLLPAVRRHVRGAPLSLNALYAGEVRDALEAAFAAPPPQVRLPAGGDREAARMVAEAAGLAG